MDCVSDSADHTNDHNGPTEQQMPNSSQQSSSKSLQNISTEPTLLDIETQESLQTSDLPNGHQPTQIIDSQAEHLPEPPESPAISSMAHEDSLSLSVSKVDSKVGKSPSANRLSISYARSNRRLVIDAEVVETLKLFRQEGRIEVLIKVQKQDDGTLKGILVGCFLRSLRTMSLNIS